MRIAIMQPYLFPYIGYFQLISAVDRFVVYDDVAYIKQGWINRNRILNGDRASYFTVPLVGASSFRLIRDIEVAATDWRVKLVRTFEQTYAKAPQFTNVISLIRDTLNARDLSIADLVRRSLRVTCEYLRVSTRFVDSSIVYQNQHLAGEDRVLDICRQENCSEYVNSIGGVELYSRERFASHGIKLQFLKPSPIEYRQKGKTFVPWLSIVDVLMFNSKEEVRSLLQQYELV